MPYLQALAGPPPVQTQTSWAQVSRPHPQVHSDSQAPGEGRPGAKWPCGGPAWLCRMLVPGPSQPPATPSSHMLPLVGGGQEGSLSPALCQQVGAGVPLSPPQSRDPSRPELRALNSSSESLGPASTGVARAAASPWAIPGWTVPKLHAAASRSLPSCRTSVFYHVLCMEQTEWVPGPRSEQSSWETQGTSKSNEVPTWRPPG